MILYKIKFLFLLSKMSKELLDLDELLPYIDEFGKYQKQLLWLICLPACLPCGFCAFNQLFMADEPDHWCKVPELENLTIPRRKILAIPLLAVSVLHQLIQHCCLIKSFIMC